MGFKAGRWKEIPNLLRAIFHLRNCPGDTVETDDDFTFQRTVSTVGTKLCGLRGEQK